MHESWSCGNWGLNRYHNYFVFVSHCKRYSVTFSGFAITNLGDLTRLSTHIVLHGLVVILTHGTGYPTRVLSLNPQNFPFSLAL